MKKLREYNIYILVAAIFFGLTLFFAYVLFKYLPMNIAGSVVCFGGVFLIFAGPFWALALERKIRDIFKEDKKWE